MKNRIKLLIIILITLYCCISFAGNNLNIGKEIQKYESVVGKGLAGVEDYYALGYLYNLKKDYSKSIDSYKKALELDPQRADICTNLGITYRNSGDLENALKISKKAVELNPNLYKAHYALGRVYYHMKKYDSALVELEKAKELKPDDLDNLYFYADTYRQLKNYEKAEELFIKTMKLDTNPPPEAYFHLAMIYGEKKEYMLAIEQMEKVIKLLPKAPEPYWSIAVAYKRLGKIKESLEYLNKAEELFGPNTDSHNKEEIQKLRQELMSK